MRKRVLRLGPSGVVDDSVLMDALAGTRFELILQTFTDEDALSAVYRVAPDIVLLPFPPKSEDRGLVLMSDLDVVHALTLLEPAPKVIVCAGAGTGSLTAEALRQGAAGVIAHGMGGEEMFDTILLAEQHTQGVDPLRRTSPRAAVNLRCKYRDLSNRLLTRILHWTRTGTVLDVSKGGLRLRTNECLHNGLVLELELDTDPATPLWANANVVWSARDGADGSHVHGLRFGPMSVANRKQLYKYLHRKFAAA